MNAGLLDWLIMAVMLAVIVTGVIISRKYMSSVADFLTAGRTAGRYLVSVSGGIAALGAITVIAKFEFYYQSGFSMNWWDLITHVFLILLAVSGWVIYRFRETRAMTLAQFFEVRYSRKFRIFTGFIIFIAGIINFGIFPAVGARFFINFLGFPKTISMLGLDISTFALIIFLLISTAIFFVFVGGQVAVLVTDFIQGIFISIVFVIIVLYFFSVFEYDQIFAALQKAPENASLLNPFKTGQAEHFNFLFFAIGIFGMFYGNLTWQGSQGSFTSAKDAHESKMGQVLGYWRLMPQILFFIFIPVCAYTVLNSSDFLSQAGNVNAVLDGLDTKIEKSQLTVPLVLLQFLPVGLIGGFAAVMLAAFISTHDTYLHSWGTIFVQDVYMPLTKKKLSPEKHIRILRVSIIGVAVFIFLFSLLFEQTQYILLFFAITSAIFAGGGGAVIVFGLYWKRGTTAGAWSAIIAGASISIIGIILHQIYDDFFIDGQEFFGISMIVSSAAYIIVSLLSKKKEFNLDKMLHRGKYKIDGEHTIKIEQPNKILKLLGIGKEFSRGDIIIYIGSYAWISLGIAVFIFGTIYYFMYGISDSSWMRFWYIYLIIYAVVSVIVIFWFLIGGVGDISKMFKRLRGMTRDASDDGSVYPAANDVISEQ